LTEGPRQDGPNGGALPPSGHNPGRGKSQENQKEKRSSLPAKTWSKNEDLRAPSSTSSRYIKAPQGMGRRLGGQNSRGYIEREYMKSSAMSDTSEAPSLASHVRRVRVPSQASDVDQYLDDLFIPVLEHQMADDMSDARSLAASIKGGGRNKITKPQAFEWIEEETDLLDEHENVMLARTRQGSFKRKSLLELSMDDDRNSLMDLYSAEAICRALKGGGGGVAEVDSQGASSSGGTANGFYQRSSTASNSGPASPPLLPMNTMPLYSPGGKKLHINSISRINRNLFLTELLFKQVW